MAGRQYQYTTLFEAAKLPKTDESKRWEVNVYAVILECDVARQTKGTGELHPAIATSHLTLTCT